MNMRQAPADELAALRAKIATLRVRESALEAAFLEMNDTGMFPGFSNTVHVERTRHQVFDISKLPAHVLDDPRFHTTRVVTRITVEPRDATAPLNLYRERDWAADSARNAEVIDHDDMFAVE
ncbi:hypothetical protein [Celeribacter sp.]|uniref:hypothetical protein n=1 Tax=Celeribacter sp. TaxID=1890673 RepID=UPI003A8C981D